MSGSTEVEVNIPPPVTTEGWGRERRFLSKILTMTPLRKRQNWRLLLKEKRYCIFVILSISKGVQAVFLLVWYYVGVFVCESTFQHHSLDLLVLMAEQLKTERHGEKYVMLVWCLRKFATLTFPKLPEPICIAEDALVFTAQLWYLG